MVIDDIYSNSRGVVVTGRISAGCVKEGDKLILNGQSIKKAVRASGIVLLKDWKLRTEGNVGECIGILLGGVKGTEIKIGMVLSKL